MDASEFQLVRQELLKTQKQMSELLGISLKAVQRFEQGWRIIPPYVERQALFLLALKMETQERLGPCWEIRRCPPNVREICPAWEFKSGHLCWFINGTVCQGKPRGDGVKKWSCAENARSSIPSRNIGASIKCIEARKEEKRKSRIGFKNGVKEKIEEICQSNQARNSARF